MILVIANYRTGSTTLIKELHQKTGYKYWEQYTGEWLHLAVGYRPPSDEIQLYKVMPDHMLVNHKLFATQYLNVADKLYFTLRKDVRSQIDSMIRSSHSGFWHPGDISTVAKKDILIDNHREITFAKNIILNNLKWQKELYNEYGGEIVYLEDRECNKYKRHDNIIISDYNLEISDAEKYFNE